MERALFLAFCAIAIAVIAHSDASRSRQPFGRSLVKGDSEHSTTTNDAPRPKKILPFRHQAVVRNLRRRYQKNLFGTTTNHYEHHGGTTMPMKPQTTTDHYTTMRPSTTHATRGDTTTHNPPYTTVKSYNTIERLMDTTSRPHTTTTTTGPYTTTTQKPVYATTSNPYNILARLQDTTTDATTTHFYVATLKPITTVRDLMTTAMPTSPYGSAITTIQLPPGGPNYPAESWTTTESTPAHTTTTKTTPARAITTKQIEKPSPTLMGASFAAAIVYNPRIHRNRGPFKVVLTGSDEQRYIPYAASVRNWRTTTITTAKVTTKIPR